MKHLSYPLRLLMAIAFMTLLTHTATAYVFMVDGLCYSLNSDGKTVYVAPQKGDSYPSYTKLKENIKIPSSITYNGTTYPVTAIGKIAFRSCKDLISVIIPNTVTSIGLEAFKDCSSLTTISMGNSVVTIDNRAFYGCKNLSDITIPNSTTWIGSEAFYGCRKLTSINIGNSVNRIEEDAFRDCYVNKVTISDIAAWCRIEFRNWRSNPLPGARLFLMDKEVKDLVIPNSVTEINDYAFYLCSGLTSLTIPNSVTSINDYAFYLCSGLTSLTIPNSVTSINDNAFAYCSGLTSVTIPKSTSYICSNAFYGCI